MSISKDTAALVLTNTFKVAPENQQALIDLLDQATEKVMSEQPGSALAMSRTSPSSRGDQTR